MSTNAISPTSSSPLTAATPESKEATRVGPDHDGDADDRAAAVAQTQAQSKAQQPTVNAQGKPIGTTISTSA